MADDLRNPERFCNRIAHLRRCPVPLRFLVLKNSDREAEGYLSVLRAYTQCEIGITDWADFRPQELSPGIHLIIADAVPADEKAFGYFEWLREHRISTPVLAILPEHSDDS